MLLVGDCLFKFWFIVWAFSFYLVFGVLVCGVGCFVWGLVCVVVCLFIDVLTGQCCPIYYFGCWC